jgi:heat shock protein HtpX
MLDGLQPVLVYDRIGANRRTTRILQTLLALALLPVASGGAAFILPVVAVMAGLIAFAIYGAALEGKIEALQRSMDATLRADGMPGLFDLPRELLMIVAGLLVLALVVAVLVMVAICGFLISHYGSRTLLRLARASPVDPAREPALVRLVENLCIGAGLPQPRVHLVESPAPNAFAAGPTADDASLVVTRGLLTLLDRRELSGVVAHELSHIGNHDIRSSTTLAALVGTLCLPLRLLTAPFRVAFRLHRTLGILALLVGLPVFLSAGVSISAAVSELVQGDLSRELPPFLRWWSAHAMLAPAFAIFVAPIVALVIRQAVSQQRELLADADAALLTRDPEGLALALIKIGAARGERLPVGEGSVHLYFVDPLGENSWLHRLFPSHPPLRRRIELLSRMGSGLAPADIEAASEAGAELASR